MVIEIAVLVALWLLVGGYVFYMFYCDIREDYKHIRKTEDCSRSQALKLLLEYYTKGLR